MPDSPILTLRQAAAYLQLSPSTLYRLLADDQLLDCHFRKVGGSWRVHRADLEQYVRGHKEIKECGIG